MLDRSVLQPLRSSLFAAALTSARRADTASVHGLLGVDAVWMGASAGGLPAWPICVR